ncbi:DUF3576 domain-containing protein [Neptunicoccus cionae]|uniref:DUF3576 domain-containing protein n=1 Tax=Neptunicoccus cionae TaxID=2035344 RepID=UPI00256FCBDF|nr:DUF3576 domain-containing protein [Amylibacter cionae]
MMNNGFKAGLIALLCGALVGCGSFGNSGRSSGGFLNRPVTVRPDPSREDPSSGAMERALGEAGGDTVSIFDALRSPDENTNVRVNKYLWSAALETLNFLPVESADPFTGVLVMGWGRAPGSARQYRATVLVQDPALDARSLKLSIQTRSGPASAETVRRVEDAILTRARQLRVRDKNL